MFVSFVVGFLIACVATGGALRLANREDPHATLIGGGLLGLFLIGGVQLSRAGASGAAGLVVLFVSSVTYFSSWVKRQPPAGRRVEGRRVWRAFC